MQLGRRGLVFTRLEKVERGRAEGGRGHAEGGKIAREGKSVDAVGNGDSGSLTVSSAPKRTVRSVGGSSNGNKGSSANGKWAPKGAESAPGGTGALSGAGGAGMLGAGPERAGEMTDQATETMQYDRLAIAYLSLLLLPLVVGFSVKKLVMDEHAGWYSWALQSLTVRAST